MERFFKPILLGLIGIFLLVAILGGIYYWGQLSRTSQTTIDSLSKLRVNPTGTVNAVSTAAPTQETISNVSNSVRTGTTVKTYYGENFIIYYPQNWGLLTCNNSVNLEFDPVNNVDNKNITCDRAIKPVTILVSKTPFNNCAGNIVTLGNYQVRKSQTNYPNGNINYKWCFSLGNHYFNVTHRVSSLNSQATSKEDFSAKVEQLIKDLQRSTGS